VSVQPASARLPTDRSQAPAGTPDDGPGVSRWATAAVLAGLLVLVAALVAGGGRPRPTPAGLPDGGVFTGWAYPVTRLLFDGSGMLTLGCLLGGVLLVPSRGPELSGAGLRCVRLAGRWAVLWAASALALLVLAASDILGEPIPTLSAGTLSSFGREVPLGRALLVVAGLALVIALAAPFLLGVRGSLLVTFLAVVGVVPVAFTGHSAAASNHDVAVSSLVAHVLAASLWVGGLVALLLVAGRAPSALTSALPRYSALAGWCWVTVAFSGVANAWVRVGTWGAFASSGYGHLVLGKVAAILVLGAFGWWMRRSVLTELPRTQGQFSRVAAAEVTVMAATVGLAVALSRTPTPVPRNGGIPSTFAAGVLGYSVPPLTAERLLTLWRPDVLVIVTVATLAYSYLTGVRRLRRAGVHWGVGRTVSFSSGLVLVLLALCSGVGTYGRAMFSMHMVQHMTLTMLVPILLALGAPITLALRALPAARGGGPWGPREWLLAVLHSRWFAVLSHPLVAFALYIFTLYGFYFSPLFELSQQSHVAHLLVHLHFVLSGSLYFWCVLGIDPMPHRLAPPARMLLLFASLPFHAFFGVVLLSSHTVLAADWYSQLRLSWVGDRLADQQAGGGIAWAFGEVPSLLVLGAIFVQWVRSDERAARHEDRRVDAGDDRRREAYNAYLAELAERDARRP
jgi:cytochrome c oxidase assembly factor CtaG/putative copper export protein